ncbi:MAG: DUF3618 domain-containing protein [Sporichthyaceae bacterium]
MSEQTEELTAEIEAKREHLGATVDELTDRLDVKKQAGEKVGQVKEQMGERAATAREQVGGIAARREVRTGAAAVAAAGLLVTAIKTYRD